MNEARLAAARVLVAIERGRTTLATELERLRPATEDPRDQGLYQELALGTTRWRAKLDARLQPHLRRGLETLAPEVRAILRLAAYQFLQLTRVPPHAIVNESVEATRALGHPRAAGFVNAVLRNLLRAPENQMKPGRLSGRLSGSLSTELSHPEWLVRRWLDRVGLEGCVKWCAFNNTAGGTTVRPLRDMAEEIVAVLNGLGIGAEHARSVRGAIHLPPGSLGRVPASLRERLIVQDEGAQLVALALGATVDDRVLDVCAAPGGKATLIARLVGPAGLVVAGDNRPARVALLAETVRQTNTRASVVALDAEGPLPFRDTFDRVLLDVPCSGLGVVRRDPDIKWNRDEGSLATFGAVQKRMIRHAAEAVAPEGTLLYATCSSEPEENEEVVHDFLAARTDFRVDVITFPEGQVSADPPLVGGDGFLRTRPDVHQLDAYFAARLVRRNPA